MKAEDYNIIKLEKGQYLTEIEPFRSTGIPSNSILHKTITGCGITTSEIKYTKRNSIIILPNVPVIKGKVESHNKEATPEQQIMGVYKGEEVEDIRAYLASPAIYKKILTTPEGFNTKIREVFEDDLDILLTDYFMLFDECDRLVTDVIFREKMAAPMDLFFRFKGKALVSATVLPFSDERFNDFTHYVIEPQYDYSKPLTLLQTNNVLAALKEHLKTLHAQQISIFLNSTDATIGIIEHLGIKDESHAYCAPDTVTKLRGLGYYIGRSELDVTKLARYNFFTSRYFSAVDIEVDYQPDVIIITDVFVAEHSLIDPSTDTIQIAGRYRNGVRSLTHITNFNPKLTSQSTEVAKDFLQHCFVSYKQFARDYEEATSEGFRLSYQSAMNASPVATYFINGEVNSFMIDNYLHQQLVKSYYQRYENLLSAYEAVSKHFVLTKKKKMYTIGDEEKLRRNSFTSQKARCLEIAEQLDRITPKAGEYFLFEPEGLKEHIRNTYPMIAKAHDFLGLEGIRKTGCVPSKIKIAIEGAEDEAINKQMSPTISRVFHEEGGFYTNDFIVEELRKIYDQFGCKRKPTAAEIKQFFIEPQYTTRKSKHDATRKSKHGYVLNERRYADDG